jgi:hypothetical protein
MIGADPTGANQTEIDAEEQALEKLGVAFEHDRSLTILHHRLVNE